MNRESSTLEIENIGKIIQRNLATRVVGFDHPNDLALTIRDEENIKVSDKCVRLGFKTFKDLLESEEMSKFVDVIVVKDGGTLKTTYKAKRDETTRKVMEQQKWYYEREGRWKEQRRQQFQLAAKKRFSMVPMSSNQPPFFQAQTISQTPAGAFHSGHNKWRLDFLASASDHVSKIVAPPKKLSECRKSVAPSPAVTPSAPPSSSAAPIKQQMSSSCQVFYHSAWKRLERAFDKDSVLRYNGICSDYPEYNVDIVTDPRSRRRTQLPILDELPLPDFFTLHFSTKNIAKEGKGESLQSDENKWEMSGDDEEEEDDEQNCTLINVQTDNDPSDDEAPCFRSISAVTTPGADSSEDVLTEEKMRHLGSVATSLCKYQYKFRGSTPIKFDLLHKVLSVWEPLFDRLARDSQQLVDFFTLFCPKLELVYPPPKYEIDKFHLYFNANE